MRRPLKYAVLAAITLLTGTWAAATGQSGSCTGPGCLDSSFGAGGVVRVSAPLVSYVIRNVATQTVTTGPGTFEDRIIAVGSPWTIGRFTSDGALDASFGVEGVVTLPFGKGSGNLDGGAVVQPDNRIVVAGSVPVRVGKNAVYTFAIARYLPDGSLDTGFAVGNASGIAGLAIIPAPDGSHLESRAAAIALQADGKIIAVGRAGTSAGQWCLSVVRLLANGQRDEAFASGGVFTYRHLGIATLGYGVAVQTVAGEQRIVATGYGQEPVDGTHVHIGLVIRLRQDGQMDDSFEGGGVVRIAMPPDELSLTAQETILREVTIDSQNRIVAGGSVLYSYSPNVQDMVVVRLLANGAPDLYFGNGAGAGVGTFTTRWSDDVSVYDIAVQPDDQILVVGILPYLGAAVWRMMPDGNGLDVSFGDRGWVNYGNAQFWGITFARNRDGANTFVVGGRRFVVKKSGFSGDNKWTLWRYFY